MTSTALVLWAPLQSFNESATDYRPLYPEIRYRPPGDTTDPRYAACTRHRVACDCREARMAEDRAEARYANTQNRLMEQAIEAALLIHSERAHGYCAGCMNRHPCPTRNLLAPLSWRERYELREIS